MNTPALFAALALSLTFISADAQAGLRSELSRLKYEATHTDRSEPGEDHHVRDDAREAAAKLKRKLTHTDRSEPGEDHHVRDSISDAWRSRPRAGDYMSIEKVAGGKLDIVYCDAGIKRFLERKGCVKLNKAPLKVNELKSCLATSGDNYRPGERINKHIDRLLDTDMEYRNFHLLEDRGAYRDYVASCEQKLAKRAPARKAPPVVAKPAKEREVNPEFKPIDPPAGGEAVPFDVPVGGSL